jgi:hypothetical protein
MIHKRPTFNGCVTFRSRPGLDASTTSNLERQQALHDRSEL